MWCFHDENTVVVAKTLRIFQFLDVVSGLRYFKLTCTNTYWVIFDIGSFLDSDILGCLKWVLYTPPGGVFQYHRDSRGPSTCISWKRSESNQGNSEGRCSALYFVPLCCVVYSMLVQLILFYDTAKVIWLCQLFSCKEISLCWAKAGLFALPSSLRFMDISVWLCHFVFSLTPFPERNIFIFQKVYVILRVTPLLPWNSEIQFSLCLYTLFSGGSVPLLCANEETWLPFFAPSCSERPTHSRQGGGCHANGVCGRESLAQRLPAVVLIVVGSRRTWAQVGVPTWCALEWGH